METVRAILEMAGWVGAGCGVALAVYWSVALWRIRRTVRELPTARDGLALAETRGDRPWPSVSLVIPAHNEERVIAELVASLRAVTYPKFAVTLALDRCTDATLARAREAIGGDSRFQIVEVRECEPGWSGKVHAVYRGVHDGGAHNADLLLFADADTLFDPRCVHACVALLEDRKLDMLSLLSTMRHERWYELVVQPTAGMELVRQYPLMQANMDKGRRAFANGQFMLFRRECYARFGGHHEVRKELLEDIRFAQILEYYGMRCGVLIADGMLICRMYDTWAQFKKGWKRIYTEAAHRKAGRLTSLAWRLAIVSAALPALAVLAVVVGLWLGSPVMAGLGAVGAAVYFVAGAIIQRIGRGPMWCSVLGPVGAWLAARILAEAGRDLKRGRAIEWAGMKYDRR